jgi:tetratricopeptide (TPR) repeat protein
MLTNNMFKKIFIILIAAFIFAQYIGVSHSASSDSSGSDNYLDQYKEAKKFVTRAKKLEEKDKVDRATKLYSKALEKLREAYKTDRNNPDILNYLGFTLRKTGKFKEAEKFYLAGLKIKPNHNGINEYLGELYVKTGRMDMAKERLAVLKNCNCEEYNELKEVIEKN